MTGRPDQIEVLVQAAVGATLEEATAAFDKLPERVDV